MAEVRLRVLANIGFDPVPVTLVIPDSFARSANGQQPAQGLDLLLLRPLHHRCELNIVCDIHTTAHIAGKLALWVGKWHATIGYPAVGIVMPAQPILHLKLLPFLQRVQIGLQTLIEVIRVNTLAPAAAKFLFQRAPGKVQPPLVEVITCTRAVGAPDQYRSLLNKGLVLSK